MKGCGCRTLGHLHHLLVEAGEDGGHRDHGGGADQHAEDGEERAELVGAQGVERQQQILANVLTVCLQRHASVLRSQRLNGIEPGGFAGGVNAEKEAHRGGEGQAHQHGAERNRRGEEHIDHARRSAGPAARPRCRPCRPSRPTSITNCLRMSRRRAPSDLRMPISWVRSVTLASMMFMMTMPPTTMKTATMPMVTAKMVPVRFCQALMNGVGGVDAESVVLVVRDVAAGAHQGSHLVLQLHHLPAVRALMNTSNSGRVTQNRGRWSGECGEVILALAERAADFLRHADHPEGNAGQPTPPCRGDRRQGKSFSTRSWPMKQTRALCW